MNYKSYFCNERLIYTIGTSLVSIDNISFDYSKYVSSRLILNVLRENRQVFQVYLYVGEPDFIIQYYHFVGKYGRNDWDELIRITKVFNPEVKLI
jgi:hypothetical protein